MLPVRGRAHGKGASIFIDRRDARLEPHVDADLAELLHEPPDEVRIKAGQHPVGSLKHGYLRTRAGCYVRELGRDVTTADQHDPLREATKFEKCRAGDGCLFPWDARPPGHAPGGDQSEPALQYFTADLDRARITEARAAVIAVDAVLREALLQLRRFRFGETALEFDEVVP